MRAALTLRLKSACLDKKIERSYDFLNELGVFMRCRYTLIVAMLLVGISGCNDDDSKVRNESRLGSIDDYITTHVPDVSGAKAEVRKYVDTLSQVEQVPRSVEGARAFLGRLSAIGICVDESLEGTRASSDTIIQELKARALNTKSRIDAYLALNTLMGNTVTSLDEIRRMASCE